MKTNYKTAIHLQDKIKEKMVVAEFLFIEIMLKESFYTNLGLTFLVTSHAVEL